MVVNGEARGVGGRGECVGGDDDDADADSDADVDADADADA